MPVTCGAAAEVPLKFVKSVVLYPGAPVRSVFWMPALLIKSSEKADTMTFAPGVEKSDTQPSMRTAATLIVTCELSSRSAVPCMPMPVSVCGEVSRELPLDLT